VLILAGDIGAGDDFGRCLCLFADLKCRKALVPGNHDIWVENNDPRGDSLQVYREHLPQLAAAYSCIYLDQQPLYLPEADLAVIGSINWYDYSWSLDALRRNIADWEDRLKTKRFTRGRHNDARFVRWPLDDVRFTREVVTKLEQDLLQVLARVGQAIVITHHPPFYGLSFPRPNSPVLVDSLLWDAFSGNCAVEELLLRHMERIPLTLCGHTHRARENNLGAIRGYNIGGDYHFKRLLLVDWPARSVAAHVFGDPQI
jgi:3',5'-cyclic AMP phosphodiesterase CpdA